jgi:hypothetical protein
MGQLKKAPKVDSIRSEEPQSSVWQEGVAEWVQRSCDAQGVLVKVTDLGVLGQVAVMLGTGRLPIAGSNPPGDFKPSRIEPGAALDSRIDSEVIDESADYGALTIRS